MTKKVVFCVPTVTRPYQQCLDSLEASHPLVEAAGWESCMVNEVGNPYISAARATMLRKALDAFARLDVLAAAQVVRQDLVVDDEFRAVIRQLITFVMEDPRTISRTIEVLFIAKAIERIGDHAKNMSEYTVYMVKGRDVRHTGIDEIEREAAQSA